MRERTSMHDGNRRIGWSEAHLVSAEERLEEGADERRPSFEPLRAERHGLWRDGALLRRRLRADSRLVRLGRSQRAIGGMCGDSYHRQRQREPRGHIRPWRRC